MRTCSRCKKDKPPADYTRIGPAKVEKVYKMCNNCAVIVARAADKYQGDRYPQYGDGRTYGDVRRAIFTPEPTERQKRLESGAW